MGKRRRRQTTDSDVLSMKISSLYNTIFIHWIIASERAKLSREKNIFKGIIPTFFTVLIMIISSRRKVALPWLQPGSITLGPSTLCNIPCAGRPSLYSTVVSLHCCALYNTVFGVQCSVLYTVVYSAQSTVLYTAVYSVQCRVLYTAVYSVQCSVLYTAVYSAQWWAPSVQP